jgi:hypothetical protein
MRSRARGRTRLINLISLGVILMGCLFVLLRPGNFEEREAIAAPPPKLAAIDAGVVDAGAPAAVLTKSSSESAAAHEGADRGPSEVEPIELAIAPDGGVPYHPEGARFRSPFAKPNPGPTVRVTVGMLLNSVDEYDVKTGTFSADFFLSLTSGVPMPSLDLQFPNGKIENKEVIADKPTFKLYRFLGSFKSPPDLRKYPFDSQDLKIIVEDDSRGIDQVRFSADKERTQLARGFRALGWQVSFVEARSLSQSYPDRFEGDDLYYGRYIFTLGLERFATSAAFKVFVPAFVIVIIALLGMWVPPGEMEVRSNAGAPMLAGAVLFHYSLIQELPATSYLTRADKLMLAVYISLALGMISTWWMFLVKEENMDVVFRIARILVPVLTVMVMAFGCLA